jgi:hypothetical protein
MRSPSVFWQASVELRRSTCADLKFFPKSPSQEQHEDMAYTDSDFSQHEAALGSALDVIHLRVALR